MRNRLAAAAGLAASALVLAGCVDLFGSQDTRSDAERAYDACVSTYNSQFRDLPGPKTMVAGIDDNGNSRCFWVYDGVDAAAVQDKAMANCRARMPKCYVFANDDGLQPWARRISDRYGGRTSPSPSPSSNDEYRRPTRTRPDSDEEERNGRGSGPQCRVDPVANMDQAVYEGRRTGVGPNTCSARGMTRSQCAAVPGYVHFKPDHGSGFTECFWNN